MDKFNSGDRQSTTNLSKQVGTLESHPAEEEPAPEYSDSYATDVRTLTTCALLAALGVASSTALLIIPNVEMMTIVIFVAGYRYGLKAGVSTTLVAVILFQMVISAFFGLFPLVALAKFPAYLLTTTVGSILGHADHSSLKGRNRPFNTSPRHSVLLGIIGLLLTFFYDLLTTLAFGISIAGANLRAIAIIYFLGLPFTIMHEISNFIIFFWYPTIMHAMDSVEGTRRAGAWDFE